MTTADPTSEPVRWAAVEHVFRIRPSAAAPVMARRWVRWVCAERDLPAPIERSLAFIAGELVAMSVRQVRAPLDLGVTVEEDRVIVRVLNRSAHPPARDRAGASSSRSLQLVECVADAWGDDDTEDGHVMWAAVGRPRGRRAARALTSTT